ncbi:hypothetical protein [Streptomyces sp. NBC_00878]|uniref:hypothetical protein n=1 Tax=Streptomyces sp. NBC_00878 TaxID=2975854 RepID=UPI002252BD9D|nr:hypothetical protein [Streptomyces sp. NBC_00878]MCX4907943.1 hypothetical protein [Streptomyces sp. NBC_00878]
MSADSSSVYEVHFTWTPFQLLSGAWKKRLVAFRVDGHGVTLGGAPARYERQTALVPWDDIEAVVLWQQDTAALTPMRYVGLRRRAGAPVLPGPNSDLSRDQTGRLAPHVDHDVFLASRHINLWALDRERLAGALRAFAPGVLVEETTNPAKN